ncbi:MAG: hypothetical protein ACXAEU_17920 [Candidatus Hodarchaeales archaeon]|jgi:hypothetical protein
MVSQKSIIRTNEKLLISIGISITAIYLILGLLFPLYDWDIADWMALNPVPVNINFYSPVIPHAILPGLLVGLFANITLIPLLQSHIIVSCIFSGLGLTFLMLLSYKITNKLVTSVILGIMFSFTRTFLLITLSGENDLFGAFYIAILFYFSWKVYNNRNMTIERRNNYFFLLGLLSASLTIFHLQMTIIGVIFPGIFVLTKEKIPFREILSKIRTKELLLPLFLAFFGYGIGMLVLFALISPFMGYSPANLDLILEFARRNLSTTESFTSNPGWFFLSSGRSITEQLDIWLDGMIRAFYHNQFTVTGDFLSTGEFPFIALSCIFCINPVVNYIFQSPDDPKKDYFRVLLVCELFYAFYMFLYEPNSLERWSPFVIMMCWHNALILDFPVLNNLDMNDVKEKKFLIMGGLIVGVIVGFFVDQFVIRAEILGSANVSTILMILNLIAVFFVGILILTPEKWARFFRKYQLSVGTGLLLSLILGFFIYMYVTSVFLYLINCNASQAGWC